MEQIGWSLVDGNGAEVQSWGDVSGACAGVPNPIFLPNGDHVHAPQPGPVGSWQLVERHLTYGATPSTAYDGGKVVVTRQVSVDMIIAERARRLALGFDYDFEDVRGVHRIGTTKADLDGWNEVSSYAGALIASGDTSTTIGIVTDTGPCAVTAPEWRAIEIAAAVFRQPIWAKSFVLMASNPIPADYTNDQHWT